MAKKVIRYNRGELIAEHCYIMIHPKTAKSHLYGLVVPQRSKTLDSWVDIYNSMNKDNLTIVKVNEFPLDAQFVEVIKHQPWNNVEPDEQILVRQSIMDKWEIKDFRYDYEVIATKQTTYMTVDPIKHTHMGYRYALQVKTREV